MTRVGGTFNETVLHDVPSATDVWAVLAQSPGIRMRGYDVGGADGFVGIKTRAAVKDVQQQFGMPADSFPTAALLNRL